MPLQELSHLLSSLLPHIGDVRLDLIGLGNPTIIICTTYGTTVQRVPPIVKHLLEYKEHRLNCTCISMTRRLLPELSKSESRKKMIVNARIGRNGSLEM